MRKISIDDNVYTVMGMYSLSYSDTVRGNLESRINKDFKDYPLTKIEFAFNRNQIGVVIIPTPLEYVCEYFELIELEGAVPGFKLDGFALRDARDEEKTIIREILTLAGKSRPRLRIS